MYNKSWSIKDKTSDLCCMPNPQQPPRRSRNPTNLKKFICYNVKWKCEFVSSYACLSHLLYVL